MKNRITSYHAKYFAYDLTRQFPSNDLDKLTSSLHDAQVDLNPHQVEAALFAFKSPLSNGAILADEVGLGKPLKPELYYLSTGLKGNVNCLLFVQPI